MLFIEINLMCDMILLMLFHFVCYDPDGELGYGNEEGLCYFDNFA